VVGSRHWLKNTERSERDQRLISLRDDYGLSFVQIAARLGIRPGWACARYHELKDREKMATTTRNIPKSPTKGISPPVRRRFPGTERHGWGRGRGVPRRRRPFPNVFPR